MIKTTRRPGYLVDPVAFFVALIAGPLLVTALSFWIFLIPVFALILGGPVYLIMGTPLLLIHLRRNEASISSVVGLALLAVLALVPLIALASWALNDDTFFNGGYLLLPFALVFAPLWAAAFGKIYLTLRRDFYAVARPI